jgi:hypothetical protein
MPDDDQIMVSQERLLELLDELVALRSLIASRWPELELEHPSVAGFGLAVSEAHSLRV